jgi:hypothetical protein
MVKKLAREHFNCPILEGVPLEEGGGAGSTGSHWERTTLNNEYMTSSEMYLVVFSKFTLAAF